MLNKKISIAIDGPAGAGKSTIAKLVAKKLSLEYIDTGSMYRALTLKVLKLGINPSSKDEVVEIMKNTHIDFRDNHIYLDNKNVDKEIRENSINNNVSDIAKIKEVREGMVSVQKQLAKTKSVVMDGRDIGTVVLPEANYKFFITASIEERANRRYKELVEKEENNVTLQQVQSEMIERDTIDSTRESSPLLQADDAYIIDNTHKTIEECVKEIISIVLEANDEFL